MIWNDIRIAFKWTLLSPTCHQVIFPPVIPCFRSPNHSNHLTNYLRVIFFVGFYRFRLQASFCTSTDSTGGIAFGREPWSTHFTLHTSKWTWRHGGKSWTMTISRDLFFNQGKWLRFITESPLTDLDSSLKPFVYGRRRKASSMRWRKTFVFLINGEAKSNTVVLRDAGYERWGFTCWLP